MFNVIADDCSEFPHRRPSADLDLFRPRLRLHGLMNEVVAPDTSFEDAVREKAKMLEYELNEWRLTYPADSPLAENEISVTVRIFDIRTACVYVHTRSIRPIPIPVTGDTVSDLTLRELRDQLEERVFEKLRCEPVQTLPFPHTIPS